jgi:hypothetical protein
MDDDEMTEAQVAEANDDSDEDGSVEPPHQDPDQEGSEIVPDEAQEGDGDDGEPESFAVNEARQKEWDRVSKYLAKNVGDIEGDDAIHKVECPLCRSQGTPGYIDPRVPADSEIIGPVLTWFGMASDDDFNKDPYCRKCDTCNGKTKTLSGSDDPMQKFVVCFDCQGRGWIPVGPERGPGAGVFSNGPTSAAAAAGAVPAPSFMPDGTETAEVAALREKGYIVMPPPVLNP